MNKAYLINRGRRITLIYMLILVSLAFFIISKLIGMYFSTEIVSLRDLVFSDINSNMFTEIVQSFNPSVGYYLESGTENRNEEGIINQMESLFGYNIPLMSFIINNDDYVNYTIAENFPKIDIDNQVVENELDRFVEDENSYSSHKYEDITTTVINSKYSMEQLNNFEFLKENFYHVNEVRKISQNQFPIEDFMKMDMSINSNKSGPKILIYHTHSQEDFMDSVKGEKSDIVVGLGDELARLLEDKYNIEVIHHRKEYDIIEGKGKAYQFIENPLKEILNENPSIEIFIDIHRDGVHEDTRLVSNINGKDTAQIMFVNGLAIYEFMPNPFVRDNLAFSFQMQLKANELYPGFARRIYLKDERFNLHIMPKTLLIEVGAQTNTVEEAQNAVEPLAKILYEVIKGEN